MWSPDTYNRFAAEREQPFWDLFSLLERCAGGAVVDLGCGDGRLTASLHQAGSRRSGRTASTPRPRCSPPPRRIGRPPR